MSNNNKTIRDHAEADIVILQGSLAVAKARGDTALIKMHELALEDIRAKLKMLDVIERVFPNPHTAPSAPK